MCTCVFMMKRRVQSRAKNIGVVVQNPRTGKVKGMTADSLRARSRLKRQLRASKCEAIELPTCYSPPRDSFHPPHEC